MSGVVEHWKSLGKFNSLEEVEYTDRCYRNGDVVYVKDILYKLENKKWVKMKRIREEDGTLMDEVDWLNYG